MFKNFFILTTCLLSNSVLAGVVTGLSAGPTWIFGNRTHTFYLEPDLVNTYKARNETTTLASGELFVGWQTPLCLWSPLIAQVGLSLSGAGNARLEGDIWDDADPRLDNSTYRYKVNHAAISVAGRVIGNCHHVLEPYLSASIGVGFNHAYNFTIHPRIPQEVVPPSFESHTSTTFTYTFGIGFQTSLTPQVQAAIGYEFSDWGKTRLSKAPGQTVNQGLWLNNLYANQLKLSLFYLV